MRKFFGLTQREAFEAAACHMLVQNKKSYDGSSWSYRNTEGLSCGVGCLIPDDVAKRWDAESSSDIKTMINEDKINLSDSFVNMLKDLQNLHDIHPIGDWKWNLHYMRDKYFPEEV